MWACLVVDNGPGLLTYDPIMEKNPSFLPNCGFKISKVRVWACLVVDDGPCVGHDAAVVMRERMVAGAGGPERVTDDSRHTIR